VHRDLLEIRDEKRLCAAQVRVGDLREAVDHGRTCILRLRRFADCPACGWPNLASVRLRAGRYSIGGVCKMIAVQSGSQVRTTFGDPPYAYFRRTVGQFLSALATWPGMSRSQLFCTDAL
jgi:hypothetical protein